MTLNNMYYVKRGTNSIYAGKYGNKIEDSENIVALSFGDGSKNAFCTNEVYSCENIPEAVLYILVTHNIGLFEEFYYNNSLYYFTDFGDMIDSESKARVTNEDMLLILLNPDYIVKYKKKYWYVDIVHFVPTSVTNNNTYIDRYNFLCENMYDTEEEAKKGIEKMKAKLRMFVKK